LSGAARLFAVGALGVAAVEADSARHGATEAIVVDKPWREACYSVAALTLLLFEPRSQLQ